MQRKQMQRKQDITRSRQDEFFGNDPALLRIVSGHDFSRVPRGLDPFIGPAGHLHPATAIISGMNDLRALPKVELHLHLDCSLSFQAVSRLVPSISMEEYAREYIAPLP